MSDSSRTTLGSRSLALPAVVMFLIIPLVLVLALVAVRAEFQRSRELGAGVLRSYDERLQLQTVFSLVQDAETGQRGYIITGQSRFLEPYKAAVERLDSELERLDSFQAEADAQRRITRLRSLIAAKRRHMEALIQVRAAQGEAAARAAVATGEGKRLMDAVRAEMAAIQAREVQAVEARAAAHEVLSRRTERVVIGLFIALAALLMAAFAVVFRQRRAEHRLTTDLQSTAARQQAIFESTTDALVTFNRSGTIAAINRAGEAMLGYRREELARRDIATLLSHTEGDAAFLERLSSEGQAGGVLECAARRKDGSAIPVEVAFGRFDLPEGVHVVAAIRDITERRRVERMKSEFVSTVSHELRTPLTSISGSLGLVTGGAAGPLPEKAARLLEIAASNCQRLVRLINDILDIEKIESGQLAFQMAPQDLAALARRSVEELDGLASNLGVQIDFHAAPEAPKVRGDADRLTQVVTNLLSNAAKFSPRGATVQVRVTALANGRVRLSVADQGPGVPEDFQGRIFSKFAQADASDTRRKGGTGLGLAISREIVERHGGRIWFESEPGRGAVFHVDLPSLHVGAAAEAQVLICEDDPDAARVLIELLERDGVRSLAVGTLQAARSVLETQPSIRALLLDLHLPDGDGLEFLKGLRADGPRRDLPVLIVSGAAAQGEVQALNLLDWIQKPLDVDRLRAALSEVAQLDRPLVLHVEDDPDIQKVVAQALSTSCEIIAADSLASARTLLKTLRPKVAILDLALGDGCGLDVLAHLQRPGEARTPVIVFSAQSLGEDQLSETIDAVLVKSKTSLDELAQTVKRLGAPAQMEMLE